METKIALALCRTFVGTVIVLVVCFSLFLARAQAQGSQGQNAVCTSTMLTGCAPTVGTSAFIDASMFKGKASTICGVLNYVLKTGFTAGAAIDARGLNSTNTSMTCTASPWAGITSNPPGSTILLPAGTIVIPATWFLPSGTHLIGQGDTAGSGTTLQASSTFSGTAMVQFGSSTWCSAGSPCSGIGIEKLILDGQGKSIVGIWNQLAQTQSYLDHVSLYQILGTGLEISGTANNSGPYTNINFNTGTNFIAGSSTVCAQINLTGSGGTHGIRGLSCNNVTSNLANAAVLLDSSSNSLKDVTILGFSDGVLVGSNAAAHGNVLVNVIGDTPSTLICNPNCRLPVINAVHISNVGNPVTDLVLMGISNVTGGGTFTLHDDVTSTQLATSQDPYVGLYVLGNAANGGHARFTTSSSVPTWASGTSTPSASCAQGSLYSCTGSASQCTQNTTSYALFGCPSGTWTGIK